MSFESLHLTPKHADLTRDGAVGVYIPGIDADINNTGNRTQEMANRLGIPFLLTDLTPLGKPTVDEMGGMPTREANQPSGEVYVELSQKRVDFVRDRLAKRGHKEGTVLLMGDSLGVPIAQGMQLHADTADRFDAVLLRDGWNLGPSENATRGRLRYLAYMAANAVRDQVRKAYGDSLVVPNYGWEDEEDWPHQYELVGMVRDVTDLMRSFETRRNAIRLAGRSAVHALGLNVMLLKQGLSGSIPRQDAFIREVGEAYSSQCPDGANHTFRIESVSGWHNDLLDPARGARDVIKTLELIS